VKLYWSFLQTLTNWTKELSKMVCHIFQTSRHVASLEGDAEFLKEIIFQFESELMWASINGRQLRFLIREDSLSPFGQ
jgi:hypothetical protein